MKCLFSIFIIVFSTITLAQVNNNDVYTKSCNESDYELTCCKQVCLNIFKHWASAPRPQSMYTNFSDNVLQDDGSRLLKMNVFIVDYSGRGYFGGCNVIFKNHVCSSQDASLSHLAGDGLPNIISNNID